MEVRLVKSFSFEAAHSHDLPGTEETPVHGHSFRVDAVVSGPVDPRTGWVIDFARIKEAVSPVISLVDHRFLDEIEGLESPSSENVARWIQERVRPPLRPYDTEILVYCREETRPQIESLESDSGLSLPERLGLRFEAAHHLPRTPEGHKCRRLHGHSYRLEVGGAAPEVARPVLEKLFERVDHRNLNEVEGLENPTAEVTCRAFWDWFIQESVKPECVVLSETCESRCLYFGD